MTDSAAYHLYYWPSIPGRGELVRLALEDAGAPYRDVAREPVEDGGGVPALLSFLRGEGAGLRPLAPPFLVHGEVVLSQAAAILDYLGPRLGLAPEDAGPRAQTLAIQLTLADLISEVHDSHHPIGPHLYYEDQREEARRRSHELLAQRLGKYLRWLESLLARGDRTHLVPGHATYADLSAFHVLEGLAFAFPRGLATLRPELPLLTGLAARVRARPRVAAYLASPRRVPFGDGIFRHYPELDLAPGTDG